MALAISFIMNNLFLCSILLWLSYSDIECNNTNQTLIMLEQRSDNVYILENPTTQVYSNKHGSQDNHHGGGIKSSNSNYRNSSDSFENLVQLNKLTQNEKFFKNISYSKFSNANIKFEFSNELITLLDALNLNVFKLKIRKYSEKDAIFELTTNLLIKNNVSNANTSTNFSHQNKYCWKIVNKTNLNKMCYINLNSQSINFSHSSNDHLTINRNIRVLMLNTISFNLKQFGNLLICFKFLSSHNKNIYFINENMCFDWVIKEKTFYSSSSSHSQNHRKDSDLKYKPLFIAMMYLLCFLVLFPIILWQHATATFNKNKLKNSLRKQKKESRNSVDPCFKIKNELPPRSITFNDESEANMPLLRKSTTDTALSTKTVKFNKIIF